MCVTGGHSCVVSPKLNHRLLLPVFHLPIPARCPWFCASVVVSQGLQHSGCPENYKSLLIAALPTSLFAVSHASLIQHIQNGRRILTSLWRWVLDIVTSKSGPPTPTSTSIRKDTIRTRLSHFSRKENHTVLSATAQLSISMTVGFQFPV